MSVLLSAAYGIFRLQPAIPSVEKDNIAIGNVVRGTMVRQVRGTGRFVPEEVAFTTAETGGRVKKILVEPGMVVTPETILAELDNPAVEKKLMDVELSLKMVQGSLTEFLVQLENNNLDLKAATFRANAAYDEARLQAEIDDQLWKNGLISRRQQDLSIARAKQALDLRDLQIERVRLSQQNIQEQLTMHKRRVEIAQHELKLQQIAVDSLNVRTGTGGTLQQIGPTARDRLEVGQQVPNGAILAIVATTNRLRAELEIPQSQAHDILVGQRVLVETVSGRETVEGEVSRIDPAVQDGIINVQIRINNELPRGARPDLSVYGIIEIDRVANALYIDRPPYVEADSKRDLFKLTSDGVEAVRTTVSFGRSSISTIQILEGLSEGDRVILSDMSAWNDQRRLAIQ
jgi:HlyD family secretion protein